MPLAARFARTVHHLPARLQRRADLDKDASATQEIAVVEYDDEQDLHHARRDSLASSGRWEVTTIADGENQAAEA